MNKTSFIFILAIICVPLTNAEPINLIYNGGFELPGFTVPAYYRYLYDGDSTTIDGWTVADDGIGEASYLMHDATYGVYEGTYGISLNQGSSLTTYFPTVSQGLYRVSFYASGGSHPDATPLIVKVGDHTETFTLPSGIQTFDFTASSTNASTLFQFINDAPVGDFKIYTLDSVSIIQIPEPATLFFIIGSMGSIFLFRYFKN